MMQEGRVLRSIESPSFFSTDSQEWGVAAGVGVGLGVEVADGVLVPGVGLPLFPVVVPPFAVMALLFPVVVPPLKVVVSGMKVIVPELGALLLGLGVALGVGLPELDELAMGGGGKPGV